MLETEADVMKCSAGQYLTLVRDRVEVRFFAPIVCSVSSYGCDSVFLTSASVIKSRSSSSKSAFQKKQTRTSTQAEEISHLQPNTLLCRRLPTEPNSTILIMFGVYNIFRTSIFVNNFLTNPPTLTPFHVHSNEDK